MRTRIFRRKELIDIISSQEDNADILSSSSEDEAESSRLENLHWCRCKNCVIGLDFTLEECLCCKECGILTQKMEGINCITEHKDFNNLILNSSVLELGFISNRRYHNNFKDISKLNNK